MADVYMPQKKNNTNLLSLVGMGAGAMVGGGAGAGIGAQIGGTLGGLNASNGPSGISTEQNAMQRRMAAKSGDTFQQLRDAVDAVPNLPDDLRKEYARPLLTAYTAEAQKRGIDPFSRG